MDMTGYNQMKEKYNALNEETRMRRAQEMLESKLRDQNRYPSEAQKKNELEEILEVLEESDRNLQAYYLDQMRHMETYLADREMREKQYEEEKQKRLREEMEKAKCEEEMRNDLELQRLRQEEEMRRAEEERLRREEEESTRLREQRVQREQERRREAERQQELNRLVPIVHQKIGNQIVLNLIERSSPLNFFQKTNIKRNNFALTHDVNLILNELERMPEITETLSYNQIKTLASLLPTNEQLREIKQLQALGFTLTPQEEWCLNFSSIQHPPQRCIFWLFLIDYEARFNEAMRDVESFIEALKELDKNETLNCINKIRCVLCDELGIDEPGLDSLSKINMFINVVDNRNLLYHVCELVKTHYEDTNDLLSDLKHTAHFSKCAAKYYSLNSLRNLQDIINPFATLDSKLVDELCAKHSKIDREQVCFNAKELVLTIHNNLAKFSDWMRALGYSNEVINGERAINFFNMIIKFAQNYSEIYNELYPSVVIEFSRNQTDPRGVPIKRQKFSSLINKDINKILNTKRRLPSSFKDDFDLFSLDNNLNDSPEAKKRHFNDILAELGILREVSLRMARESQSISSSPLNRSEERGRNLSTANSPRLPFKANISENDQSIGMSGVEELSSSGQSPISVGNLFNISNDSPSKYLNQSAQSNVSQNLSLSSPSHVVYTPQLNKPLPIARQLSIINTSIRRHLTANNENLKEKQNTLHNSNHNLIASKNKQITMETQKKDFKKINFNLVFQAIDFSSASS